MKTAAVTLLFSVLALVIVSCVGEHTDFPNEEGLVLSANKTSISLEDTEGVKFTVTDNGVDVTDQCIFANVTEEIPLYLDEPIFVSKRPGTYNFQAFYGDNMVPTNEVSVRVRNTAGGTSNFYRRILVADYTGTWCSYCYQMVNSINAVAKDYPDRLMVLAIHVDDEYSLGNEAALESAFNITGLPTSVVDWRDVVTNAGGSYAISRAVKESLENDPTMCGISIETKLENNQLTINTNTCFLERNQYKIGVVLVEDGIVGTQASVNGSYTHNNMVRAYATRAFGDEVKSNTTQSTDIASGEEVSGSYSVNFSSTWKKENCRVVVYILKKQANGSNFYVNNVQDCRIGSSIGFEYESE
ncbi:Omp28-related outer membrane protein [Bacteroides timonensis]|uniref:Omp28-related outer membrane protein n=1 Tax=Bacteroides timonensis TaxID=1470345 RepID=UPI001427B7AD|nr:Omp28-related outer membrane protein [Bacteroides timonensis]